MNNHIYARAGGKIALRHTYVRGQSTDARLRDDRKPIVALSSSLIGNENRVCPPLCNRPGNLAFPIICKDHHRDER